MSRMTYLEAGREAVLQAMRADPTVWCVGEDLGRGGVFGQYKGLAEEFGSARIADAPISAACIMGAALGAAMTGTRPIVEMRFSDFALCAVDELVNQAAKARFMFGGRCDDPVVYMEHKNMWALEGEVDLDLDVELGKARLAREGRDLTIVSWSAAVHGAVEAGETLAAENISAEVIDLRSLWPWDKAAVLASVRKTGRLIVAQEAVQVGGFGAEVAATVAERAHAALKAPVKRLGAPRAPIAYAARGLLQPA